MNSLILLTIYIFIVFLLTYLSAGKDLALLQAEASACVKELANVPNVRWHF